MAKTLVTGAAGFIGSHVVDELLKCDHEVVAFDDLSGGDKCNVSTEALFVKGSILDSERVDSLFEEHKFEYVFHLAAYAAEGLSHFIKRFNYENNLIGSVNIINASVNSGAVKCFVFASSIAVYGRNQVPMTEDMVPQPEDPYGIAKYAVEMDLKEARKMFGLNYIIFRPHNVYGERQNIGDPYRNVIGIFMNNLLQGKPMTIFGDGSQTRAFSYISDVAPIIAASVTRRETYNEIYNIGADTPYTVNELSYAVAETMGLEHNSVQLDARNEVQHAYSSHDKVCRDFGDLMKNVPLQDGLSRMAAWVKAKGSMKRSKFGHLEVHRNLPASWKL